MCYIDGSIDQATSTCPMCKVFRPSGARCPHRKDTCRNKALHPRHDVVHFKNAEVQTFNGCGYCKWASRIPSSTRNNYVNAGWPGCCRRPTPEEYAYIPPADWLAVSVVFRMPIPPDIKQLLDSLTAGKGLHAPGSSPTATRGTQQSPPAERRAQVPGRSNVSVSTRSPSMTMPPRARSGGSPLQMASALTSPGSRPSAGHPISANDSPTRRPTILDAPEKRIEGFRTTPPGSIRKLADADGTIHRAAHRRPSLSGVSPMSSIAAMTQQPSLIRRASTTHSSTTLVDMSNSRMTNLPKISTKSHLKKDSLEDVTSALSLSAVSDSSSDTSSISSRSSATEGTVTSDGGFTDYLSDESEAELQRQAEVKAALLEQSRAEEQEFKAARQQLASVDLRPPQSWNRSSSQRHTADPMYPSNHNTPSRGALKAGLAAEPRR